MGLFWRRRAEWVCDIYFESLQSLPGSFLYLHDWIYTSSGSFVGILQWAGKVCIYGDCWPWSLLALCSRAYDNFRKADLHSQREGEYGFPDVYRGFNWLHRLYA